MANTTDQYIKETRKDAFGNDYQVSYINPNYVDFSNPANQKTETAGDVYTGLVNPTTPEDQAILDAEEKAYQAGQTQTTAPDESQIRADTLSKFQSEIDALDRLYAQKKADITTQYTKIGNERVGETGAIQARRGLIGSDFGTQATQNVVSANQQELNAAQEKVDAELQAAKESILSQVRVQADKDYTDKLKAYQEGANATVEYLKSKKDRSTANTNAAIKNAILRGVDISNPEDPYVIQLAKSLGVVPENLSTSYKAQKATYEAEQKKTQIANAQLQADLDKTLADIGKSKQDIEASKASILKTQAETQKILNESKNKDEKDFYSDILDTQLNLSSGKTDWGQAFSFIKGKWNAPDTVIDKLLNKDVWSVGGAYQEKVASTVAQKGIEIAPDGSIVIH